MNVVADKMYIYKITRFISLLIYQNDISHSLLHCQRLHIYNAQLHSLLEQGARG